MKKASTTQSPDDLIFRSAINRASSVKSPGVRLGFVSVNAVFVGVKKEAVPKPKRIKKADWSNDPRSVRLVPDIVVPGDSRYPSVCSVILRRLIYGR